MSSSITSYENLKMVWTPESSGLSWISNYVQESPSKSKCDQISAYGRLFIENKIGYIAEIYITIPKNLKEKYNFITKENPYKSNTSLIKIQIYNCVGSLMHILSDINRHIKILFNKNFQNIFEYDFSFIKL